MMAAMRRRAQTFFRAVRLAMWVERSLIVALAKVPPPPFFPPMNRPVVWIHQVGVLLFIPSFMEHAVS